jgi:superfamily I DNA/RNA helicase
MPHPWELDLNFEQREAVMAEDGPVMIVAGPGTGKTKTLAARVAYLLLERGIGCGEVLALTFTVKAAREMQARVRRLVGTERMPEIQTFHGVAARLAGGNGRSRRIVADAERATILRALKRPPGLNGRSLRELTLELSLARNAGQDQGNPELAEFARSYTAELEERGAWDYDEMLAEAARRLSEVDAPGFAHVLVDEFQDTSGLQYEIAKRLARQGSLFVIGDEKQAIYGFRGASGGMFARFGEDFPGRMAVALVKNYRSGTAIVSAGNAVFPGETVLTASGNSGPGRVRVATTLNEYSEADLVVREMEAVLGGTDLLQAAAAGPDNGTATFQSFAVVYRTHAAAKALRSRLERAGLPYQVAGEGSPYERPEIACLVAAVGYLAGFGSPERDRLLALSPFAKLADRQADALLEDWRKRAQQGALVETVRTMAGQLGYEGEAALRPDIAALLATLTRFECIEDPWRAAAAYLEDLAQNDFYDERADAVALLTIHAAKGLEFERVFLIGANEGILPYERPGLENDAEEERRLFYVAVTRAKNELEIITTKNRGGQPSRPSRFLQGLPSLRAMDPAMPALERKLKLQRTKRSQGSLF